MQRRACGFSLIEVAIVFAIIGLVAAAILLSGSGVFGRTGVASLLSNVKDLATASREFKVRYGYFPGDLPKAGTVIKVTPPILGRCAEVKSPQLGNGIVDHEEESDCALEHLVRAGMLSKIDYGKIDCRLDPTGPEPESKFFIASTVGAGVCVSLWSHPVTKENAIRITKLPCDVALDVDRRLDSATEDNKTPFKEGTVRARKRVGTTDEEIPNCTAGEENDPVDILLIKY